MKPEVKCNGIVIRLEADFAGFSPELTCKKGVAPGLFDVQLRVSANKPAILPTLTLSWQLPSVDFHYKWNARCYQNRVLDLGTGLHRIAVPAAAHAMINRHN